MEEYFQTSEISICKYHYHYTNGEKNISGNWHTDNVGKKINFLICLEGYGNCPTLYQTGTHRKKYKVDYLENLRFLYKNEIRFNQNLKKKNIMEIKFETGDIGIIDANGKHRGGYDLINNKNKPRLNLFIEFLPTQKIEKLGYFSQPKWFFLKSSKAPYRQYENCIEDKKIPNDMLNQFKSFSFLNDKFFKNINGNTYYDL